MSATEMLGKECTKESLELIKRYFVSQMEFEERMRKIERAKTFIRDLSDMGIKYDYVIKHKEVLGCDESSEYYKRFSEYLDPTYSICKHMLVHERKGDRTFLIITDFRKKVDLSKMREELDCKKLEFVKEEDMKTLIDTTPGNVSIFNIISDKEDRVEVVFDKDLLTYTSLAFHPLYNEMSMFISPSEVVKFMAKIGKDMKCLAIAEKPKELVKTVAC